MANHDPDRKAIHPKASHNESDPEALSNDRQPQHHPSQRPGAAIMSSEDPSTAALRAWAEEKQRHTPGQDGSIAVTPLSMMNMAWGGAWSLPRKGDTLPPPDQRVAHGEPRYLGPDEETEQKEEGDSQDRGKTGSVRDGKMRNKLSRLFHKKEKSRNEDKGLGLDDVVR